MPSQLISAFLHRQLCNSPTYWMPFKQWQMYLIHREFRVSSNDVSYITKFERFLRTSRGSILRHSVFKNWFSGLWRRVALYFCKCFIKRHCLLLWLYWVGDRWAWSDGGMVMRGRNWSTWSETRARSTLPTKTLVYTGPPSNTDPCGEKPAT